MPRTQNKLSAVQQDPRRFSLIKAAISAIGPDELAKTGHVGRTSIFKYQKGSPVNPKVERGILTALRESGGEDAGDLLALADDVIQKIVK